GPGFDVGRRARRRPGLPGRVRSGHPGRPDLTHGNHGIHAYPLVRAYRTGTDHRTHPRVLGVLGTHELESYLAFDEFVHGRLLQPVIGDDQVELLQTRHPEGTELAVLGAVDDQDALGGDAQQFLFCDDLGLGRGGRATLGVPGTARDEGEVDVDLTQ